MSGPLFVQKSCPKASPFGSNGDDRRQWRKQGGAVGAAASRMRAATKQTLGAATRAVSPQVTERARALTKKNKHSDSIALTKGMLIAAQRLCRDGLALSGAHAPALPKGEPLACRSGLRWTRKAQFTAKWSASLSRAGFSKSDLSTALPALPKGEPFAETLVA